MSIIDQFYQEKSELTNFEETEIWWQILIIIFYFDFYP